jgi:hypothetical protein
MKYVKFGEQFGDGIDKTFHYSGANALFVGLPLIGAGKTAISGGFETLDAFWWGGGENGPGGYETLGRSMGEFSGQILEAGAGAYFAYDIARKMGSTHAFQIKAGGAGQDGLYRKAEGMKFNSKSFKQNHLWKNGKFWKPAGFLKSIGVAAGAALLGAGLTAAGTMTGRALDTMLEDTSKRRKLTYDSRFFSGERKYDQGSYDQFGGFEQGSAFKMQDAMNQHQSSMVSMARVYHSR